MRVRGKEWCGFGSGESGRQARRRLSHHHSNLAMIDIKRFKIPISGLDLAQKQLRKNEVIDFPKFHLIIRDLGSFQF
jgi:hypothetical protein